MKWLILFFSLSFNAAANILIKSATRRYPEGIGAHNALRVILDPYLLAGLTSFGLALVCYTLALSKFPLSVAYPINVSVGAIFVYIWSAAFFAESVTPSKLAGVALILAGVVLISRGE